MSETIEVERSSEPAATPAAAPERTLATVADLSALPDDGQRRELIRGEIVAMPPAGERHGFIGSDIASEVSVFARKHGLGRTTLAETGFVIARDPDTVRAPDMAFIAAERMPETLSPGFSEVVPDLVLEVVSPSDTHQRVLSKVGDWLDAGVRVVWVVWPEQRRVQVFGVDAEVHVLDADATLTCPDLLPGFELPLEPVLR